MPAIRIRPATAQDADFIAEMVVEAVNWRPDSSRSRDEVMSDPALAHYAQGWMRPSDLGVVAVDGEATRIGAAWLRQLPGTDPGYGYVSDGVPELSIAVVAGWRGRGVGRALIRALLAEARARGTARVSLSVERDNPAVRLYAAEGFRTVASSGGAHTMVTQLR